MGYKHTNLLFVKIPLVIILFIICSITDVAAFQTVVTGEAIENPFFTGNDYSNWSFGGKWRSDGANNRLVFDVDGTNTGFPTALGTGKDLSADVNITGNTNFTSTANALLTGFTFNGAFLDRAAEGNAGSNADYNLFFELDVVTSSGTYRAKSNSINNPWGQVASTITPTFSWEGGSFLGDPQNASDGGIPLNTITSIQYKAVMQVVAANDNGSGTVFVLLDNLSLTYQVSLKAPTVEISGSAGWRLLSLPVSGGGKVTDISDDTAIQGVTGGSNTGATTNIIQYKSGSTFSTPTNTSTDFGAGYGVGVYFYNNTTNGSTALPITLDVSGSEPSSDVDVTLNTTSSGSTSGSGASTSKYTLIGNPFASNYDINQMTYSGDGIQDNVQFWNDGSNTYTTGDKSSAFIISPWQGFWVEVSSAQSTSALQFPTSGKTTSSTTATYFSKDVSNNGDISFSLKSETTTDEAIKLAFREYATTDYDRADASKLMPLSSTFATMAFKSKDLLKAVESLPWDLKREVKLDLEEQLIGVSGLFTFDWKGLESLPSDWELTFHDYETGISINMWETSEYKFEAFAQAKANPSTILQGPVVTPLKSKSAGTRFGITVTPSTSVSNELDETATKFALDQNYPNPFNPTTTINYSVENAGEVNISIYNLMGQKVAELVNGTKSEGSYNVTWNASGVSSGMYYYRLEAGGQSITRKMTLIK